MSDEASVIPSGPLVIPSAALLLTSVERPIATLIPKVSLSLLVAETSTTLVPSEIPAVLVIWEISAIALLTRRPIPI